MTNNFEKIYQAYKALDKAFDGDVVENDVAVTLYRCRQPMLCRE